KSAVGSTVAFNQGGKGLQTAHYLRAITQIEPALHGGRGQRVSAARQSRSSRLSTPRRYTVFDSEGLRLRLNPNRQRDRESTLLDYLMPGRFASQPPAETARDVQFARVTLVQFRTSPS